MSNVYYAYRNAANLNATYTNISYLYATYSKIVYLDTTYRKIILFRMLHVQFHRSAPEMIHKQLAEAIKNSSPKLSAKFFQQEASRSEPVRDWLKSLPEDERKAIGEDIKAAQYGWPLGLPLLGHIDGDIWEVRTKLANRIARVLFVVEGETLVLLHGFIKKTQKTPRQELELAKDRLKILRGTR